MYSGPSFEGALLDIDDECLIISANDREIILEASAISMVQRLGTGTGDAPQSPLSSPQLQGAFPPVAVTTLNKLARMARATSLEIDEPDWNAVYDSDLDSEARARLSRDLIAVRNRYQYAVRVKENDRILQCVDSLRKIAEDHEAPDALQIAGRILWQLGQRTSARDTFARAAEELNDSSSCFDLAMAQRETGERERTSATLRNCLTQDSDPRARPLMALTRIALTEGAGTDELAGLVHDAGGWRSGDARLAVLQCGLVCVSRADLAGFPAEQWDAPDAPPTAFDIVAQALHPRPTPPAPRQAKPSRHAVGEPAPAAESATGHDLGVTANDVAVKLHAALSRKDFTGAERALAMLKALAPLDQLTWQAERALSFARANTRQSATTPARATPAGEVIQEQLVRHSGMPAGENGPFVTAEEAFHQDDLEQAEQMFRLAIATGDQPARAVRRLANMLSARLKRRDDAIEVLDKNKRHFRTTTELWGWSQDRSTILEHAGRWPEAVEELRVMLTSAPTRDDRIRVVKRMTAALLKDMQYQEAKELLEKELRRHPRQQSLETLLDQLNAAMETGIWSAVEMTPQLQAETTTELSPLLAFHLERCTYWGVPAESLARREFTEEDIKRVDNLVSGRASKRLLGTDLPRERAEANLSAARIMQDLGITDDGFRKRLRYFAAAMGDACALEARVTADVIRAYYTEAVSVKSDWDDTVDFKLRQLVMSFILNNVQLLEDGKVPPLERALTLVTAQEPLVPKVLAALLALPTQGEVAARLIRRIWNNRTTREVFQQALATHLGRPSPPSDQAAFTTAWVAAAEHDRDRRKAYRAITSLTESGPALPALDRHSAELERIYQDMRDLASATDLTRIASCQHIVSNLRQYLAQTVYVERERLFGSIRHSIRELVLEFETAPTLASVETLHPYLLALDDELSQDFERYAAKAAPETLKVEVVLDRYLPSQGEVTVQLQVSNGPDASPVSNVELEVVHTADYTAAKDVVRVAESIGAGESRTCQVSLLASASAIAQELITLRCEISFTLRSGQRITAPVEPKSIRLDADADWVEIPNPYAAGLPVEDPRMFMGRNQLIGELVETVGSSRGTVIVYGQKRAGKSSVLYHLKAQLATPHLAVSFGMMDLVGGVTFGDLLYVIGQEIYEAVSERVEDDGLSSDPPPEPNIEQIRLAPLPKFIEYMRRLHKWMAGVPELAGTNLVLLIDEFTVIHKEIRVGNLPADFMKGWKALLEKGFFRCVLVGNDLMPRFIQDYPNEFQVAAQKRVSYLNPIYARRLIEDPIRLPDGQSRYRGNAVDRILELTGCSPYYIQLFCHELVQYMNKEDIRTPVIGPADVDAVARGLIAELDRSQFDNLLTPGDSEVTNISGDLALSVLRETRRDAGPAMYHEVNQDAHADSERVIDDLARREVLKRIPGDRYRIQVGLFREWLQHQWA